MNSVKTIKWLKKRNIVLEKSFVTVLREYAEAYKIKQGIRHLDEVYRLLGTSRQNVAFWEKNPCSVHTKKKFEISGCE